MFRQISIQIQIEKEKNHEIVARYSLVNIAL